jgi:hypothetical protein
MTDRKALPSAVESAIIFVVRVYGTLQSRRYKMSLTKWWFQWRNHVRNCVACEYCQQCYWAHRRRILFTPFRKFLSRAAA